MWVFQCSFNETQLGEDISVIPHAVSAGAHDHDDRRHRIRPHPSAGAETAAPAKPTETSRGGAATATPAATAGERDRLSPVWGTGGDGIFPQREPSPRC